MLTVSRVELLPVFLEEAAHPLAKSLRSEPVQRILERDKEKVTVDKLLAVCYDVCDLKGENIMLEFISSRINDFNIGFLLTS